MNTHMETQKVNDYESRLEELLKDKEKIIAAIKSSPALQRRNREAAEMLARVKPPFPWDNDSSKNKE